MENEKTALIGEWKHNIIDYAIPALVVRGELRDHTGWSDSIEFLVDTGYDGELLIAYELFLALRYDEISFPEQEWGASQTVSGEIIKLHTTQSMIRIGELHFEVTVEASPQISENLMGRGFINRFLSVNNGYQSKWSLYQFIQER